jgi:Peptidase S24-like/Protein of unknown function (DUF3037)
MLKALLGTQEGRYLVLEAELPDGELAPIGVLLQDTQTDRLYVRLRRDWDRIAPDDEVLPALAGDLQMKSFELGAERLLAWLEKTASTGVRVTDREPVLVDDFERSLNRLYRRYVEATVCEFETHVPRYSLQVAAGRFLENAEIEAEGWEEVPADERHVSDEMFAARIVGTSMEPEIPDGSVCLFRRGVTGSRIGRKVLVEELGRGGNDRFTVKVYTSRKVQRPDEAWSHEEIRLEPLNPAHEAFALEPDEERYRIVAEFLRVLY